MQNENHGSQWDIMMNVLIDSGKYLNKDAYQFSSEISTIDYLNDTAELSNCLRRWISKLNEQRSRSAALSNLYRQEGNQFFNEVTEPHDIAADYYTKSIFSAPENSIELALAHANRAACSAHMLEFLEEGYWDCELALRFNYPMKSRDKLFDRKFILAGHVETKLEETLREMEEMAENNILTEKQLKLPMRRKQYEDIKNNAEASVSTVSTEAKPPEVATFQNKKTIEKFNESVGRYVVAGEALKKNQPIYREKAFCFVPVYNDYDPNTISYHCQNCAKTNCVPFPCYNCVRASYCSPLCSEQHKSIHKFECAGYQKNLWVKIGIAHLAFRNFIVGFFDSVKMLDGSKTQTPDEILMTLTGINKPDFSYGDVIRLMTNFDKMNVNDLLRYALTAQMLAIYLDECTGFYTNLPAKCFRIMANLDDWKKLTAAVLMRHMGQLVSNGHAISDIELMPPSLCDFSYRDIGNIMVYDLHLVTSSGRIFTAIFPKISMLNHSCDPNIRNSFDGPFLSIHATRDIAENEEIFNCYGPNYKLMSKIDRKNVLKQQYCFDCNCNKCSNDDQTFEKYFEYNCPNEQCRSPITIDLADRQWWNYLRDRRYLLQIKPKFGCEKCQKPLALNPITFKEFLQSTATENDTDFRYYRRKVMTEGAVSYYMSVSKSLSKHHELKAIMAQYILKYQMHADKEEMFTKLAYIAMENYVITRERFGQFSLEVIMSITYALNILKLAKELEKESPKLLPDIAKIRKVLDIKKMEKSFTILSKEMRKIFKNAIEEVNKTEGSDNTGNRMEKLNLSSDDSDMMSDDFDTID